VDVDLGLWLETAWSEREITHLALDSAKIAPIAARYDTLLDNLVKNRMMKDRSSG
jgi:hypothetical protein